MQFIPGRIDRTHRLMRNEGIDGIIVTRPSNVQYLTGYGQTRDDMPVACVLGTDSLPVLIIPDGLLVSLPSDSVLGNAVGYSRHEYNYWDFSLESDFWQCISEVVRGASLADGEIGLELNWLSVREFEGLKKLLPDAGFRDFSQQLWHLRSVKDAAEIDAIVQAVRIAEIGMRTALELVRAGESEMAASLESESAMRRAGGQQRGIRAAVLCGAHARDPQAQPGMTRISAKDIVVIDVTVSLAGYFAEISRTCHPTTPSVHQRRLFEYSTTLLETLADGLSAGEAIGPVVERSVRMCHQSLPECTVNEPLGSSIGLDLHEPPFIESACDSVLRENAVVSLRPTCSLSDAGTVQIADMYLVTRDRLHRLSRVSLETL